MNQDRYSRSAGALRNNRRAGKSSCGALCFWTLVVVLSLVALKWRMEASGVKPREELARLFPHYFSRPDAPPAAPSRVPLVVLLPTSSIPDSGVHPSVVPPTVKLPSATLSVTSSPTVPAVKRDQVSQDNQGLPLGPDAGLPAVIPVAGPVLRPVRADSAAGYRRIGDDCAAQGDDVCADRAYLSEAAIYRRIGLTEAAQAQENRAAQHPVGAALFVESENREDAPAVVPARLEPRSGCYLGAFADRAQGVEQFPGDNWQMHARPADFMRRVGQAHATLFTYARYGNWKDGSGGGYDVLPRRWLSECKRCGIIPQIAWEPQSLALVRDDAYLESCAAFLRDLHWPVFIRFASEMNGFWTPYHGNPVLYRQKFRLVAQVLRRTAPQVAMIWCVNAIPPDGIEAYYPGDDVVDWVGVNLYAVPFLDDDPRRPAFKASPLTLLDPIYRRFAARKPIAICEFGASHRSAVDGIDRSAFAAEKLRTLYGALPLLYPRVKMVDWFCCNTLLHAQAGRRLNDYDLLDSPALQSAYRRLTAADYYLKTR